MSEQVRRLNGIALRALVALCVLVPLFAKPASAQRVLEGGQPFPLERPAWEPVVEDFNADGRLDVAVPFELGVRMFLGDRRSLLVPAPAHDIFIFADAFASGDFDGDGLPDLLVAHLVFVTLLVNQGDGTFLAGGKLPSQVRDPNQVIISDFDGDGALDGLISDETNAQLVLGDGRGSFRQSRFLRLQSDLRDLAVGDFDGDGHDDLVTATRTGVDWYRGRGDGTFEDPAPTGAAFSAPPLQMTSGDFLEDGLPDLAVVCEDGAVFVIVNSGGGFFLEQFVGELPGFNVRFPSQGFFHAVDYDGDGSLDIITPLGGFGSSVLRVFLGFGDGTFALELDVALGVELSQMRIADLDGDGQLDALVARGDVAELVVFRGSSPGALDAPLTVPLEIGPRDVAFADVNQDGAADVVLMSSTTLSVVRADGAGGFEPPERIAFADRGLQSIIAADFGRAANSQVVLTDNVRGEVVIVSFAGGAAVETVAHPVDELPTGLAASDFDRDGATDLAVIHRHHPEIAVLLGAGVVEREPREVRIPVGSGQSAVAAGDVDGDGAVDLLVTTREGLVVLYGDGAGAFPRRAPVEALANTPSIALADVDGDGTLDLVAAVRTRIAVVREVGHDGRSAPQEIDLGVELSDLEVVDFGADGRLEAVTAASNAIAVTRLTSAGGFGSTELFTAGVGARTVAVADLDGDGRLDAASADFVSRSLTVLRGAEASVIEQFRRGDADASGQVNLADALVILSSLFGGAGQLECSDAGDADDDGSIALTDAVRVLLFLFGGVGDPPAPGPADCGPDPTADALAACLLECL